MTIDLRSDTFTVPDKGMRKAMAEAEVGDDVFAEDPTVNRLQEKIASYFGKESSLFVPSGTMGNQLGLRVHTNDGDEVLTESQAHIFYYETSAPSIISRLQLRTLDSQNGEIPIAALNAAKRTDEYYFPETILLSLESSHNRHGGYPLSREYMNAASGWAHQNGISTHLDGARIWNSIISLGVDPKEYVSGFETISVCFSKGLGAPVGSALVGSKAHIRKALKWRKILGGGMRQAGIVAAGAEYAFDNNLQKLEEDHKKTYSIAEAISDLDLVKIDMNAVKTNILRFEIKNTDPVIFLQKCKDDGLLFMGTGNQSYRIVLHHQITDEMVDKAIEILRKNISE
jgi:threonine aldolase